MAAYARAYLAGGRVLVPVAPLLTELADRVWFEGDTLILERGTRRVRVKLIPAPNGALNGTYVPAAPVLAALGVTALYEPAAHALLISIPRSGAVASPTPFNPAMPSVSPGPVFTPVSPPVPQPIWSGSPLPRRTALPFPPPD